MRVATWNVSGLRAALRKGLVDHLGPLDADVLLLQEVRATVDQLPWTAPPGYRARWHPAERAGYAGTATWVREGFESVEVGRGMDDADPDGRVLRVRVCPPGQGAAEAVELVNVYLPSGSAGPASQARKDAFLERFVPWARALAAAAHPVVVAGDLNVAPTERDIHDPKGNKRNSGFLPHERAAFAALLEAGLTDVVRMRVGEVQGPYTWWSHRGQARALDRGWRIDHVLANPAAVRRIGEVGVYPVGREGPGVSDHAPVWVSLLPGSPPDALGARYTSA